MASTYLRVKRGDAAQVLQQIEDDALATQQHARVVADDGEHLAGVRAHAVEHFGMADDFEAGLRLGARVEAARDLKEARNGAKPGDDQLFAGDDGAGGAQVGIDGEIGRSIAGGLVLIRACSSNASMRWLFQSMGFPAENSYQLLAGSYSSQFVVRGSQSSANPPDLSS